MTDGHLSASEPYDQQTDLAVLRSDKVLVPGRDNHLSRPAHLWRDDNNKTWRLFDPYRTALGGGGCSTVPNRRAPTKTGRGDFPSDDDKSTKKVNKTPRRVPQGSLARAIVIAWNVSSSRNSGQEQPLEDAPLVRAKTADSGEKEEEEEKTHSRRRKHLSLQSDCVSGCPRNGQSAKKRERRAIRQVNSPYFFFTTPQKTQIGQGIFFSECGTRYIIRLPTSDGRKESRL